jgi:hypothetical protein
MKVQGKLMDTLSNEYKPEVSRPGFFQAVSHSLVGIVVRLDQFFTVSDEERMQAGVDLSGEGRDGLPSSSDDIQL